MLKGTERLLAGAVAVLLVLGVGALFVKGGDGEPQAVDTPTPTLTATPTTTATPTETVEPTDTAEPTPSEAETDEPSVEPTETAGDDDDEPSDDGDDDDVRDLPDTGVAGFAALGWLLIGSAAALGARVGRRR